MWYADKEKYSLPPREACINPAETDGALQFAARLTNQKRRFRAFFSVYNSK